MKVNQIDQSTPQANLANMMISKNLAIFKQRQIPLSPAWYLLQKKINMPS